MPQCNARAADRTPDRCPIEAHSHPTGPLTSALINDPRRCGHRIPVLHRSLQILTNGYVAIIVYQVVFGRTSLALNRSVIVRSIRHCLVATLCICASLGHAPAWLHVASCEDCLPKMAVEIDEESGAGCGHCGCTHHSSDLPLDRPSDRPLEPHDSEACSVCQSLACPVGFGELSFDPAVLGGVLRCVPVRSHAAPKIALLGVAAPRGPPTIL